MDRRGFIRVLGGGVALAGVAGLGGCATDYPPEAVAAWAGPSEQADLRRWVLGFAILAPNSHNRQPWLVDLREPDAITLHVDRDRTLPMTDPWYRQIMVSQGTFIESLVIALNQRGVDAKVALFPQGEFAPRSVDDRPVARISWERTAAPARKDPLFAQLLRRHTAKADYDTARAVSPDTLATLHSAVVALGDTGVAFAGTVNAARIAPLRTLCWESAKVELLTPRTVMESLKLTRVGPEEISRHRDGISVNGTMPRLFNTLGLFDRSQPPAEGSAAYKQMMSRFEGHSNTAMGFVWLSTATARHAAAGTVRSAEVNAGRAYLRLQLKATEIGLQMHPMSQAPQEFPEMKVHYDNMHQMLVGKPAAEETVQMFCRIGYCAEQPHTPRRGVEAIVRA